MHGPTIQYIKHLALSYIRMMSGHYGLPVNHVWGLLNWRIPKYNHSHNLQGTHVCWCEQMDAHKSPRSKKDGKDQETKQSKATPDPGYNMGKWRKIYSVYNKHHQQEPRGQLFPCRWPQGSNEQTWKHDKHRIQKTQMIHEKSTTLERSVKIFTWVLKPVSARLPHPYFRCLRTLISYYDSY